MPRNAYQKFLSHATAELKVHRPTWTLAQRRDTITTLYHGDATIKQHYQGSNNQLPTLLNLLPVAPYAAADATHARTHRTLPAVAAPAVAQPTRPVQSTRDGEDNEAPQNEQETRNVQNATDVQDVQDAREPQDAEDQQNPSGALDAQFTAGAPAPATAIPMTPAQPNAPYEFWPPLPWPHEPFLPTFRGGVMQLADKDTFMKTKPSLSDNETNWHGARFLNFGTYGAVGLWCEVDKDYNVIDRMVVKDTAPVPRATWRDPMNWRDHLPQEIAIHRRIESRRPEEPDACGYIVGYKGHRLRMSERRYRLYQDYAAGGDLDKAVYNSYHKFWYRNGSTDIEERSHLPEAFIWHVVKALASACLILQHGTTLGTPVQDWRPIMHLDIQPPNVLLGIRERKRGFADVEDVDSSGTERNKRIKSARDQTAQNAAAPSIIVNEDNASTQDDGNLEANNKEITLMLTDFGLSFFDLDFGAYSDLADNPHAHLFSADSSRYAPEQAEDVSRENITTLDERTNVWGIGRIAWSLIVNQPNTNGPRCEYGPRDVYQTNESLYLSRRVPHNTAAHDAYDEEVLVGTPRFAAASLYSEPLKDLVRRCLKWHKHNRPDPRELLDEVDRHLEANPHLRDGGLKAGDLISVLPNNDGFEIGQQLVIKRPDR